MAPTKRFPRSLEQRHDCNQCKGTGKTRRLRPVRQHDFHRGGKKFERGEHEKEFLMNCNNCSADAPGKVSRRTARVHAGRARRKSNGGSIVGSGRRRMQDAESSVTDDSEDESAMGQQTCSICSDEKSTTEFQNTLTQECEHDRNVCQKCAESWINSEVEVGKWNSIKCPECPQLLGHNEVSKVLGPQSQDFQRFAKLSIGLSNLSLTIYEQI